MNFKALTILCADISCRVSAIAIQMFYNQKNSSENRVENKFRLSNTQAKREQLKCCNFERVSLS